MKTRIIAKGYYEDLEAENLHYILQKKNGDTFEPWLEFFDGNKLYIDCIEIKIMKSVTEKGQNILTFNYEIEDKKYSIPMFHEFTGRFALTKGALINGIFHYNKNLSKLEQTLIDLDISIRCIRYVENVTELDTIYTNINKEDISPLFMKYLLNKKIQPRKLIPKEYTHSIIKPISREAFEIMKGRGWMIIEKVTKETEDKESRTLPSIIFIVKGIDKSSLIAFLKQAY